MDVLKNRATSALRMMARTAFWVVTLLGLAIADFVPPAGAMSVQWRFIAATT